MSLVVASEKKEFFALETKLLVACWQAYGVQGNANVLNVCLDENLINAFTCDNLFSYDVAMPCFPHAFKQAAIESEYRRLIESTRFD